jgi:hypothetical protein
VGYSYPQLWQRLYGGSWVTVQTAQPAPSPAGWINAGGPGSGGYWTTYR